LAEILPHTGAQGAALAPGAASAYAGGECPSLRNYAALDLGTNNCRLLVARPKPDGAGFNVTDAFSRIVRLGEGVEQNGVLSRAAIDRTVSALRVCAGKMRRAKVVRTRTVATEACRRAGNGADFLRRVRNETGIELEIIEPGEEAALALAGCTPLIDPGSRYALVFDIGGGSTELIWVEIDASGAQPARVLGWTSLALGVVTLTERYGGREIAPEVYRRMVDYVAAELGPFEAEHDIRRLAASGAAHLLGTSGTVTTLAAVHLDLPRYDRAQVDGVWINVADIGRVSTLLGGMSFEERARHACIRRARADLIVAGCAILEAIIQTWPMQRLRVADRGLREGMLSQMMAADRSCLAEAAD
jgi:exopolyphosphatase/guanosine-5'-triphosphate,3'-diphosphate pyrophosphatase